MKRIVISPNFFIIELSCILLAIILWRIIPRQNWLPMLIAIAPLVFRIVTKNTTFIHTPFNLPILIYLLTAGIGIWAAYQTEAAWMKFWFLITSVLLYFLLARQPVENLWKAAVMLSLLGLVLSVYFFLCNDWEAQPQKFILISQLGEAWMRIRPNLNQISLNPNDIAGIAVLTLPFSFALILRFWRKKSYLWGSLFVLFTGIIGIAIIFTQSRGVWLAVSLTLLLCSWWWILNRWLIRGTLALRKTLYAALVGVILLMVLGVAWVSLNRRLIQVAIGGTSISVSDSRFHLFLSAFELIKDTPFTGGGLESFSGLYSTYIMNNPNYILGYSHNIFLDTTLQQGLLGGLMLCWIILGSLVLLIFKPLSSDLSILRYSILSSLLIMILHGLVDNVVLRTIFTMLIFFVPGMAVGLLTSTKSEPIIVSQANVLKRQLAIPGFTALLVILGSMIFFQRPILSAWFTNLGAVEMAKVQLADFPTGVWDEGQHVNQFFNAEALFNRALFYDPSNPNANYRLGLIAMLKKDFPTAVNHLVIAHLGNPYHRGIIKALGLSYLWNDQVEVAQPLLSLLPESNQEINIYAWWWAQQNRPDLAAYAKRYLRLIGDGQ